jgi:hypothetical protein
MKTITNEQHKKLAALNNTYRKSAKKQYLTYYLSFLQTGEDDPDSEKYNRFGLSYMGAQAIRLNVAAIIND